MSYFQKEMLATQIYTLQCLYVVSTYRFLTFPIKNNTDLQRQTLYLTSSRFSLSCQFSFSNLLYEMILKKNKKKLNSS